MDVINFTILLLYRMNYTYTFLLYLGEKIIMSSLTLFNRLVMDGEMSNIYSDDEVEKGISLEEDGSDINWFKRVKEFIKNLLTKCYNRLIRIREFIKNRILRLFKDKQFKTITNRIKDAIKLELLDKNRSSEIFIAAMNPEVVKIKDEKEYQAKIKQLMDRMTNDVEYSMEGVDNKFDLKKAWKKVGFAKPAGDWWLLLNGNGKVRSDTQIFKNTIDVVNFIMRKDTTYDKIVSKYKLSKEDLQVVEEDVGKKTLSSLGQHALVPFCLDGEDNHKPFRISKGKVNYDSINSLVDEIEGRFTSVESRIDKLSINLERELQEVNKEIEKNNTDETRDRYKELIFQSEKLQLAISLMKVPIYYLANFSRLLKGLSLILYTERFITTTTPPSSNLFHISKDEDLGKWHKGGKKELHVRFPDSGSHENLPMRISFSPSPELCCYGLGHHMPYDGKYTENEEKSITRYLYKGKPKNNETRYIKPSLVKCTVALDSHMSQEICVTTDIEIEYVGEIIIYYKPSKPLTDPHRYRVKMIKK